MYCTHVRIGLFEKNIKVLLGCQVLTTYTMHSALSSQKKCMLHLPISAQHTIIIFTVMSP